MAALAGNGQVVFAPLVTFEDRLGFEEYARAHVHAQVQENLDFRGIEANATDFDGIHDRLVWFNSGTFIDEPYEGSDVQDEYVVNWQHVSTARATLPPMQDLPCSYHLFLDKICSRWCSYIHSEQLCQKSYSCERCHFCQNNKASKSRFL